MAQAQALDTENGRYALSTTPDGLVVRLDTRSGAVSTCSDRGNGWACVATPDERAALDLEIGRLQAENQKQRRPKSQNHADFRHASRRRRLAEENGHQNTDEDRYSDMKDGSGRPGIHSLNF